MGISVLGATHQPAAGSYNVDDSLPHSKGLLCPPHRCRCCHLGNSLPLFPQSGRWSCICQAWEVIGKGSWLCWSQRERQQQSDEQTGREGKRGRDTGSFSFPPCRWRRAWKQCWAAGLWGAQGASPEPSGKNKLFSQSRRAGTSVLAPSTGLGHTGGKEDIFGFLGVRSQGPDYLPSG